MGVTAIITFDHNFTALLESSVFVTMIIAYFLAQGHCSERANADGILVERLC